MVTKGYGLTVHDIDWSCPNDLKPYEQAKVLETNIEDTKNWQLGQYICASISTIGKGKYPKQPVFQLEDKDGNTNQNKEGNEEVAVFEMQQRIRLLEQQGLPQSPM